MDQSNRPASANLPLERLVSSALGQLEQLGYSRRSLNRYRVIWKHLIEFSRQKKLGNEFSEILAERFLDEYRISDGEPGEPVEGWRWHIVFGIKVLRDFVQQGHIKRAVTNVERINLPPAMDKLLRDYEQYCKEKLIFGLRRFMAVSGNSLFFWISWDQKKQRLWIGFRRWISPNLCLRGIT
jgi:hypothetical protein